MRGERTAIRRWPSLSTSWGLLAWLAVPFMAFLTIGPVSEADVYWHIRMGEDILDNGRFTGDPSWTFGPSEAGWVTTQAGSELLLFGIHALTSWTGVMLFRVVLAALLTVSVILACTLVVRTRPTLVIDRSVAVVTVLVSLALIQFMQERPQSLSLVLVPWVGVLVMRVMYTDRWPRWWLLGLIVLVWSWFHGAAIIVGPLLFAAALIHALGVAGLSWLPVFVRSLRRGWLVIVAALAAPLIGPVGIGYYAQASLIQDAASGRLVEWTAPAANNIVVWLALTLVAVWGFAVVRLAAASGRIWRTFRMDLLLIAPTFIIMTSAGRYLGIGVLLLAPLVARRLAQAWVRPSVGVERIRPGVAKFTLGAVGVLAVGLVAVGSINVRPVLPENPLRVWEAMAGQIEERRVVVDYGLGGQAGLLGDVVVSIDGRADRYGGERIDDVLAMVSARPGWEETFAEYPGTTDVVAPTDSGLVDRLGAAGWTTACVDGDYTWLTAPGVTGQCADEAAD